MKADIGILRQCCAEMGREKIILEEAEDSIRRLITEMTCDESDVMDEVIKALECEKCEIGTRIFEMKQMISALNGVIGIYEKTESKNVQRADGILKDGSAFVFRYIRWQNIFKNIDISKDFDMIGREE